jgi:hypothetical protein
LITQAGYRGQHTAGEVLAASDEFVKANPDYFRKET